MINKLAIDGIDGVGKSTTVQLLADRLQAEGLKVVTFAPYRMANDRLGHDIYSMWKQPRTARTAVRIMRQVLDSCAERSADEGADVTIFDRHWMTAFSEINYNEGLDQASLQEAWGDSFVPTALLQVTNLDVAVRRGRERDADLWFSDPSLPEYDCRFKDLAHRYFDYVLGQYRTDDDVTPDQVANAIRSDMFYRR